MLGQRFEFRPVATMVTMALLALLLWLGTWQLTRAGEKRVELAAFDRTEAAQPWRDLNQPPARYSNVSVLGDYLPERQVLMEGLTHQGKPGVQVLTPLRVASGDLVMINRGWAPMFGTRAVPVAPDTPSGTVTVRGRVRNFAEPGMRLGDGNGSIAKTWPRLAIYPSAAEISDWLDEPVAARLILLDADQNDGFVRDWRPDTLPPSRHVGYAVQWYGLALALIVLFLLASRKSTAETK
ncbi:MAG: SURF1 family protein [Gammaproteobacteria bacterium]